MERCPGCNGKIEAAWWSYCAACGYHIASDPYGPRSARVIEMTPAQLAQLDRQRICPTCGTDADQQGATGFAHTGGRFYSSCPNGHKWEGTWSPER